MNLIGGGSWRSAKTLSPADGIGYDSGCPAITNEAKQDVSIFLVSAALSISEEATS
jgi:hypothetical protein